MSGSLSKAEIERRHRELVERFGPWTFDVPLGHGLWSAGDQKVPHTRLRRLVQIVADLARSDFSELRIVDLGCLDGLFSVEFALQGAREVVGVDAREANVRKCLLAQEALGLQNLRFLQDDVRNVTRARYGAFEVVLCSGLLYHLNAPDVFQVIEQLHELSGELVLIDTHTALEAKDVVRYAGEEYHGLHYREHAETDSAQVKEARLLTAYGHDVSFWLSRPSLVNFLQRVGFTSVYECFNPPHLNFGRPGLEAWNRSTFVAVKGRRRPLHTAPSANDLVESWPEAALRYVPVPGLPVNRGG